MEDKKKLRRKQILNSAFECFSQYGYAKTAFIDVAKKARVSRALLYKYFKNKDDLFVTMTNETQDHYATKSREILESSQSKKGKLQKIIEIWILDPYQKITSSPYSNDWLDELKNISARSEMRYRELFIASITPLLGYNLAEVIVLSVRGLLDDRPPVQTLKKRVSILTDVTV